MTNYGTVEALRKHSLGIICHVTFSLGAINLLSGMGTWVRLVGSYCLIGLYAYYTKGRTQGSLVRFAPGSLSPRVLGISRFSKKDNKIRVPLLAGGH